ncbi:MAG: gamma-glutamyl-gamma-aminobutyrate hydrolase family protein [Deltaproteobacteria bacterium]|nr:gamma-glutamyl-gamma-aminobutyrate hydrolase family protein [Deltaproteobacteria bacterium]
MAKVLVLQHTPEENLGIITEALLGQEHQWQYVRLFAGESIPNTLNANGLIVLGGPMGVYDTSKYPFLNNEIRLISQSLNENKPILGVCLGSQLIAAVLGARVYKNKVKEIGWYPIQIAADMSTDPLFGTIKQNFFAFHWHGDTFDLPSGAVSIGSSSVTMNQGFRFNSNIYALQFHLEVTQTIINDLLKTFHHELPEAKTSIETISSDTQKYLENMQTTGRKIFSNWAKML